MKSKCSIKGTSTLLTFYASLFVGNFLALETAKATSHALSPPPIERIGSPSTNRSRGPAMDALPLFTNAADVNLETISHHFKITSWTLPSLMRLDQSMCALGKRELLRPIPSRDDYFNQLALSYDPTDRRSLPVRNQEVRGEYFLPAYFDATAQYKAIVYSPGSGGLCDSERDLVTRMAQDLNALVFVMESNRSRSNDDRGSSAEAQLEQNHLNLALDALRMAEVLEKHPNVKGLAAAGSSLGAVALTALADRSLSGPMYAKSVFIRANTLTDPANHWENASPFEALFLLTPIFPVQFSSITMPSNLHMSLIVGSHDMWCEPFSALRAMGHTQGRMSLHLLKMGHGPECIWDEWNERIVRHSDKIKKLTQNGTDLVYNLKGQNITRCSSTMLPFWITALFNTQGLSIVPTADDMNVLGPIAGTPMKALAPLTTQDETISGLPEIIKRTTQGTLLEPNPLAVTKIIAKMREDLDTFVTGAPWDVGVYTASLEATSKARKLSNQSLQAFDGSDGERFHEIMTNVLARGDRRATEEEILEVRSLYIKMLDPLAEDVS